MGLFENRLISPKSTGSSSFSPFNLPCLMIFCVGNLGLPNIYWPNIIHHLHLLRISDGPNSISATFWASPRGRPSLWIWPGARLQESSPENPVLSTLLRMDRLKGNSIPGNHANFPPKKPDKTGNKLVFSSKMVSSTNPLKLENSILLGTILGNSGDATASGLVPWPQK